MDILSAVLSQATAAALDPSELVEVVATASYYVGTARFLSAFGIEAGAGDISL